MLPYIFKRLLLIFPTLVGIMAINFLVIQFLPGGPVEEMVMKLQHGGQQLGATARVTDTGGDLVEQSSEGERIGFAGGRGIDPEILQEITQMYGLDKPAYQRFAEMIVKYSQFKFGDSFFQDRSVVEIIMEKMPVSISLGVWTVLIIYFISIPLGILKAVRDGSRFDISSSSIIIVGYAIPNFLFAIFLLIVFAGGEFVSWFPLRGLVSDNFAELSLWGKVVDYFHHLALPIIAMVAGGFASLTMLTKNCFLDEINKQYVFTARAKGLHETAVLFRHVFRNAMLLIISAFPSVLVSLLFTSSLLIEVIFSLDGLGLLGFNAALRHDYPIVFGSLFFFSLLGLLLRLVSDILYVAIDPRIHFDSLKR